MGGAPAGAHQVDLPGKPSEAGPPASRRIGDTASRTRAAAGVKLAPIPSQNFLRERGKRPVLVDLAQLPVTPNNPEGSSDGDGVSWASFTVWRCVQHHCGVLESASKAVSTRRTSSGPFGGAPAGRSWTSEQVIEADAEPLRFRALYEGEFVGSADSSSPADVMRGARPSGPSLPGYSLRLQRTIRRVDRLSVRSGGVDRNFRYRRGSTAGVPEHRYPQRNVALQ